MPAAFAYIPAQHLDDIAGSLVLTPNERLAREFAGAYDQARIADGSGVWPSLQCMSLRRFWLQQFSRLQTTDLCQQRLLSEQEIQLRFQQTAAEDYAQQCRSAAAAWQLVRGYDVDLHGPEMSSERSRYFATWCAAAIPESKTQIVCEADLPSLLGAHLDELARMLNQPLLLVDVEHLTPAGRDFFQGLYERDSAWVNRLHGGILSPGFDPDLGTAQPASHASTPHDSPTDFTPPLVNIAGMASLGEELMAAASWVRDCHQADPNATIGVVVPDLSANYDRVLRQFAATLTPTGDSRQLPFDLSGGKSLASQPVWRHARIFLDWLRLAADRQTLAPLLQSPYLTLPWCEELKANWPRWARRKLPISAMLRREGAEELQELVTGMPRQAQLDSWVELIQSLLSSVGWTRTQALGSFQYQAAMRIQAVLGELAAQPGTPLITLSDALQLIDWALDQTFAPQRQRSNIQILGMLETTGLSFDHLWVCGMSAEQFPGKANVSPFIPRRAAVAYGLPRSTQDQELAFARRTLGAWVAGSRHLHMSYTHTVNGASVYPTPLVTPPNSADAEQTNAGTSLQHRHPLMIPLGVTPMSQEDGTGTPTQPGLTPGGTHRLEAQARCAFSAFAMYRLGLDEPPEPRDFLNPMERGSALHWIFEQLYRRFPDSDSVQAQPTEVIMDISRQALGKYTHLPDAFVALEQQRLCQLAEEFIALEAQRSPFEVIETEKRYTLDLGNLSFALRIDRLDKVRDAVIVMDYKTGQVGVGGVTDTLSAPQLPCYSIIRSDIAGVYYAQLRDGDCKILGLSDDELQLVETKNRKIKGTVTDASWQQQRSRWSEQLHELAEQVAAGAAQVNPQPNVCRYCHLKALCRVDEKRKFKAAP